MYKFLPTDFNFIVNFVVVVVVVIVLTVVYGLVKHFGFHFSGHKNKGPKTQSTCKDMLINSPDTHETSQAAIHSKKKKVKITTTKLTYICTVNKWRIYKWKNGKWSE